MKYCYSIFKKRHLQPPWSSYKLMVLLLICSLKMSAQCTGPSGLITVGPSGNYTTLTTALNSLAGGITGPVILELQSGYNSSLETFPITINASTCFSATSTLTIRPAAGANGLLISSSATGATINVNGAQFVTIDGRPGGAGGNIAVPNSNYLAIENTNTTGVAVQLDNGAANNTISYCDLRGQNTTTGQVPGAMAGVVYIGNTAGTAGTGNDNNTVDNCNIHAAVGNPTIGLYSFGPAGTAPTIAFNDNNTVSNCNIYDFFSPTVTSAGVELDKGTNGWTIIGNSFFQTASYTATTSGIYNRPIWVTPQNGTGAAGNGFTIMNNYVGGTAPFCAGTPYTVNSTTSYTLNALNLSVSGGSATTIMNNTFNNINVAVGGSSDPFQGITISNAGNVDVISNTIGDPASNTGITIAGGSVTVTHGILVGTSTNTPTVNVQSNTIAGFTLTGNGNYFNGIFCNGSAFLNITNNTIGSTTVANSIQATTTGTAQLVLTGIRVPSGSGTLNITGNNIANLTNGSLATSSASQVSGIVINSTTAIVQSITNNTIFKLSCAASQTSTASNVVVGGILCASTSTSSPAVVSGNVIHSLSATSASTSAAINIEGIYFTGAATSSRTISKNFIHSLDVVANNPSALMRGIDMPGGTGSISNNMVRLGIRPDGTPLTNAMSIVGILKGSTSAVSIQHNSVYIGGSGVNTGTVASYAFRRSATSGTDDIRNNIFFNNRSNASAGANHYALAFTTSASGATVNYNVYNAPGTNGVFAYSGAADVTAFTPGWISTDFNSVYGDPAYTNQDGDNTTVSLHINSVVPTPVEGTGVLIVAIADDIDGDTRATNTPTDIGADAGNFTAWPPCLAPGSPGSLALTPVSTSQINGAFAGTPGADGFLVVKYASGATATPPASGTFYAVGNTLGSGTVIASGNTTTFTSTGLSPATTYDYYVYAYEFTSCSGGPAYSTELLGSATTLSCSGPSGTLTVGPSATYPTLTAAVSAVAGGITGPVVLELQSNYTSTSETFPITINANNCINATNYITIRPAAGANGLVISGSNAGPAIDLNGARYVTIDGTPGGSTGSSTISVTAAGSTNTTNLNIVNTSATGAAIRMDNGASNNLVKYCDLQGQNTTGANVPATLSGVVYIGNTGTSGNDANRIDHCNIHSTGTGTSVPSIGIYVLGAANTGLNANFNDSGVITGNNIYDFFLPGGNSVGIELNQGVNAWNISNNHLFQTSTKTFTSAGYNRGIWIIPNRNTGSVGNAFTLQNNYIGGSAPQCTGTPYTLTALANYFDGIRLEVADGTTVNPSSLQGNTITNIAITSTTTTANDVFHGIAVTSSAGSVDIGTITGNTIGSATANGAITIAAGSGSHSIPLFISNSAGGSTIINVKNNTIGGIDLPNAGSNLSVIFDNQLGTVNIDNNLIGSATVANSINASNTGTTSQFVRGINISSGSGTINMNGNTIANLSNGTTSTTSGAQTVGIYIGTGPAIPSITGNNIYNLICAASQTGGGTSATLGGILLGTASTAASVISGNKIYALTATSASTTTATLMEGIFVNGAATSPRTVRKNFVHSLHVTAANPSASIRGVEVNGGTGNVENNMVRLGIRPDGTTLGTALTLMGIMKGNTDPVNVYHNSVYIGGTNVDAGTNATYAYRRTAASGTEDIEDNIFVNTRSNASSGGSHYALAFTTSTAGANLNYNVYWANGTNGVLGNTGIADVTAYTAGWITSDINSYYADPKFINPAGDATSVNLHISTAVATPVEGAGVIIAGITDDIDGDVRATNTPVDIGADAGNFTSLLAITLDRFYGEALATANELYWNTEKEETSDIFELQKSTDGNSFAPLAVIRARGHAAAYTYTDNDLQDVAYYRLKMTALSGKYYYSNIVRLTHTGSQLFGVVAYPNPASDQLTVVVTNGDPGATILLVDITGKVLRRVTVTSATATIDIKGIAAGNYILRYQGASNNQTIPLIIR